MPYRTSYRKSVHFGTNKMKLALGGLIVTMIAIALFNTSRPPAESPLSRSKMTCAFVANNPNLSKSYGVEIDRHNRVIRFNDFMWRKCIPSDCEQMWGKKTTDYVLNNQRDVKIENVTFSWLRCYHRSRWCKTSCYTEKEAQKLYPNCTALPESEIYNDIRAEIVAAGANFSGSHPTTGFLAVKYLASNCTDKMSFYGFTDKDKRSNVGKMSYKGHSHNVEHKLLKKMFHNASFSD